MALDKRTGSLIAVGASITANCPPCVEINISRALRSGAEQQEVADAVEIGRKVRAGAAAKMDAFTTTLNVSDASSSVGNAKCGCGLRQENPDAKDS